MRLQIEGRSKGRYSERLSTRKPRFASPSFPRPKGHPAVGLLLQVVGEALVPPQNRPRISGAKQPTPSRNPFGSLRRWGSVSVSTNSAGRRGPSSDIRSQQYESGQTVLAPPPALLPPIASGRLSSCRRVAGESFGWQTIPTPSLTRSP